MKERWKAPRKGNEIVSETVYLQGVEARTYEPQGKYEGNRVPIEEWSNELVVRSLIKPRKGEIVVKARINSPNKDEVKSPSSL